MIHYHGTPIKPKIAGFRVLQGRHGLISFADDSQIEMAAEVCQSFVLDNGAFVQWKRGIEMNWSKFYAWAEKWIVHPSCDWVLIPDVIEGDESANDALLEEWPFGKFGVPIWHLHESLERLDRLSREWSRVAIGSSGRWSNPGSEGWWQRMSEAMQVVCVDGSPRCKLHGLRMLSPSIFSRLPLSSADSSTVARKTFRDSEWRGHNQPHSEEVRALVLAERIESFQSAPRWAGLPKQFELEMTA